MKGVSGKITLGLNKGAIITCADNSGAKELQIIAVRSYKGRRSTQHKAGVAGLVWCRVYKGDEKVRHQIFQAVIIRQKKEYRRPSGMRIAFEDNAAIVVDEKFMPKGTLIKGPVAKEAVERFPPIAKIAAFVV